MEAGLKVSTNFSHLNGMIEEFKRDIEWMKRKWRGEKKVEEEKNIMQPSNLFNIN